LEHRHTSDLLADLVSRAPDGAVDLDWLLGHLDKRSFGLLLLLLGLLVIVPGVATAAALAILFPAVEMMLGRSRPTFPSFLAKRPFDFKRFKRFAEKALRAPRDRARQPAAMDAAACRSRSRRRINSVRAGSLGLLATTFGERHPGSGHRPYRSCLSAGGRRSSDGCCGGGSSVADWFRMDGMDFGRGCAAMDGTVNAVAEPARRVSI
jgi:hypothetical protein